VHLRVLKQNLTESHATPVSFVGECMQYEETGDGHPRCTSAEDCIGTSNDPLVQPERVISTVKRAGRRSPLLRGSR